MPRAKKETAPEKIERRATQTKHSAIYTAEQLESMTTHELADMLSNIVMLLRRMPNVPCQELTAQVSNELNTDVSPVSHETTSSTTSTPTISSEVPTQHQEASEQNGQGVSSLQERIDAFMNDKKMTIAKLRAMADELGIPYPTKPTKADLAKRVAERQMRGGHSEQYAIMNL